MNSHDDLPALNFVRRVVDAGFAGIKEPRGAWPAAARRAQAAGLVKADFFCARYGGTETRIIATDAGRAAVAMAGAQ